MHKKILVFRCHITIINPGINPIQLNLLSCEDQTKYLHFPYYLRRKKAHVLSPSFKLRAAVFNFFVRLILSPRKPDKRFNALLQSPVHPSPMVWSMYLLDHSICWYTCTDHVKQQGSWCQEYNSKWRDKNTTQWAINLHVLLWLHKEMGLPLKLFDCLKLIFPKTRTYTWNFSQRRVHFLVTSRDGLSYICIVPCWKKRTCKAITS